jgi:hypothetical protein
LSRKKSNFWPRLTYSKTRVTDKTSKPCLKPLQSLERNKNKTQGLMKRNASWLKRLRWTSISCCRFDNDLWMLKK